MTEVAVTPSVGEYLDNSAVKPCAVLKVGPLALRDGKKLEARGLSKIKSLREKLEELSSDELLCDQPIHVTLTGTLYPCALLSSGWWEKKKKHSPKFQMVAKNEIQRWLFHGFRQWAPSWDFTWNFDNGNIDKERPYFVAQLGESDEADSLPVIIPYAKAQNFIAVSKYFALGYGVGAKVRGAFGHRSQFDKKAVFRHFGGLLDYCLWLDRTNDAHTITPSSDAHPIYSGYLWKCIMPLAKGERAAGAKLDAEAITLNDVYFIWDHTNFTSPSTVQLNLETLAHEEETVIAKVEEAERSKFDWVLLQKSSNLVSGDPELPPQEFYDIFYR